jgi:hypothetical protein
MGVGGEHHGQERDQVPTSQNTGWGSGLVNFTDINVKNTSGHILHFIYLFRFELNLSITVGARTAQ